MAGPFSPAAQRTSPSERAPSGELAAEREAEGEVGAAHREGDGLSGAAAVAEAHGEAAHVAGAAVAAEPRGEAANAAGPEPRGEAANAAGPGVAAERRGGAANAAGAAVVVVVCALMLVLPAAVDPWGRLAFEPLKTSVLRVGAVIAAALWLWSRRHGGATPLDTPVGGAALALLALTGLSSLVSLAPALSAGGSFERGMGWLTLAACALMLLVVSDLALNHMYRERMLTALVLGSVVPCAYFLLQRVGLDPIAWSTRGVPGSTLASPTFLGGYLVLTAPFAAYKVVRAAHRGGLVYGGWLALLLLICAVTLLTTIRGPLVGLLAAAVTFAVLARPRGLKRRDLFLGAVAALLALVVGLLAMGGTTLQRFLTIAQGTDSSVERLTLWRDALSILSSEPGRLLIGFGPETASIVLERAASMVRITPGQQWDRAHNLVLDTWLTSGLVGVVALAVLLACAVWSLRRASGEATARLLRAAVGAAMVGHLVEAAFAFETVVTAAVFWIVLGLAASLGPTRTASHCSARLRSVRAVAAVGALLVAPVLVTPAVADALYGAAHRTDYLRGAQLEDAAAAWAPWVEELPRAAGLDWQQVATRRHDAVAAALARQDLQLAAERGVGQPAAYLRLARLDLAAGRLQAAESDCQQALAWGPYRVPAWETCGDVANAAGDPALAASRADTAVWLRSLRLPGT